MFQPDRAIEVLSPSRGSAYRIGGRLVLTAKHLVLNNATAQVRHKQSFGTVDAAIAWVAKNADIALLELPETVEPVEPVALGQLPHAKAGETIEFQMYGWPQWGTTLREQEKRAAGGRQVDGTIYLADTSPDGLLVIEPQRIPFGISSAGSDWVGMSGAAVICDGLVVAVQSAHQNPNRPQALEAAPITAIHHDLQWQALLKKHGLETNLAIAQLKIKESRIESPYFFPPAIGSNTFVGRNHELDQLHQLLQKSETVAISAIAGMGGVGKTELAWQYAHRYQSLYPAGIWWVNASRITLEALTHSVHMHLPEPPDSLQSDVIRMQWVYDQWLTKIPAGLRLLVCDDVDDYLTLRSLLPQDARFRVLLTTRLQLGQPVQRVDLDVLKKAPAFHLLRELVNDDSRVAQEVDVAKQLTEWVGRLPLGIELIGRHLANHPSLAFAKLLERLEHQTIKAKALQQRPAEMPYPVNLQAAFEVSWNSLNDSARQLAGLLSVFAISSIEREWVTDCLKDWDEEDIEEAEASLINGSLVSFENHRFLLHALLHRFFQLKLDTELEATAATLRQNVAGTMVEIAKTVPQTVTLTGLTQIQPALPHLRKTVQELTDIIEDSTDSIWPFVALARVAHAQSHWSEAQEWFQACLEFSEQQLGTNHPDTATTYDNLAGLYYHIGRYAEAEPLFQKALAIREQRLGTDHPSTAKSYNNLAALYVYMGHYPEAEPLYLKALAICEQQLGTDHPSTATSYNNLAVLYVYMGRYPEAEPLYLKALAITEQQLGTDHPSTAMNYNNLAQLYQSMGRYPEAEPLFQKALAITEQQLGTDHPSTAISLGNLAALYYKMKRFAEAEPLITRAVAIFEQSLGSDHPSTINARECLVNIDCLNSLSQFLGND